MKKANSLIVDANILKSVFGEDYWNDVENIICVPTRRISPKDNLRLGRKGISKATLKGVDYLIAEYE